MNDVPTIYDYLEAARLVADGTDPLAIAKLSRGRVAPEPKPAANVTSITERRAQKAAEPRQAGLGL